MDLRMQWVDRLGGNKRCEWSPVGVDQGLPRELSFYWCWLSGRRGRAGLVRGLKVMSRSLRLRWG